MQRSLIIGYILLCLPIDSVTTRLSTTGGVVSVDSRLERS